MAPLQKKTGNATLVSALLIPTSLLVLLGACGSAPPAPPKQLQEYSRHSTAGLEKHRDGFIGEARNAFQRALARAELDDDAHLITSALLNLGTTELLLDQLDDASRTYGRARREALLAGSQQLEWQAISGLAEATRRLGQPHKALELFAVRPGVDHELPPAIRLPVELARARALADSGHMDSALTLIDGVITRARTEVQPDPTLATAWHARATVLLAKGATVAALDAAKTALALDRALHHPPSIADDHQLLGKIAASQKDEASARHHHQRALSIYRHTGQSKRATDCQSALTTDRSGANTAP